MTRPLWPICLALAGIAGAYACGNNSSDSLSLQADAGDGDGERDGGGDSDDDSGSDGGRADGDDAGDGADEAVALVGEPLSPADGVVALSADGARLAVGLVSLGAEGSVRVFDRDGEAWAQVGADIHGEAADDQFGSSLDLSADGTRLAVGAFLNDGGGPGRGHVRVYDLVRGAWVQRGADIDPPIGAQAGYAVALSAAGDRVVIGAPAGSHAFVYELSGDDWTQVGATISVANGDVGRAVAIVDSGNRIALGSPTSNGSSLPGTTLVFDWDGEQWVPVGSPILGEANADNAGFALAFSADGLRLAIGAPYNRDGGMSGGGDPTGQVRIYDLVDDAWTQVGQDIDGRVALNGDNLGSSVALSADGARLIATGPNNSVVRAYDLVGDTWVQLHKDFAGGVRSSGVALSADGRIAVVGFQNTRDVWTYSLAR